ncbi:hypothetical protein LXL04_019010 [Taraxacum kok-saghyz]
MKRLSKDKQKAQNKGVYWINRQMNRKHKTKGEISCRGGMTEIGIISFLNLFLHFIKVWNPKNHLMSAMIHKPGGYFL